MENQKINLMTMDEFKGLQFAKCQELSEMNTLLNLKIINILLKEELKKLNKEFCGYTLEYLLEQRTMPVLGKSLTFGQKSHLIFARYTGLIREKILELMRNNILMNGINFKTL
jgi:hypothetical protein